MPPFLPTAREITLLTFLLVSLLYISSTFKSNNLTVSEIVKLRANAFTGSVLGGGYGRDDDTEKKPVTFESQYSLQTLNKPMYWGMGQVPQTQILAHVPGMCFVDLLLKCVWGL